MSNKKEFKGIFHRFHSTNTYIGNKDLSVLNDQQFKFCYRIGIDVISENINGKDFLCENSDKELFSEYKKFSSRYNYGREIFKNKENLNEILVEYFDTELFRGKITNEQKLLTMRSNTDLNHFCQQKSNISFRVYKKKLNSFIICEDKFDIGLGVNKDYILEKLSLRWPWMSLLNFSKLEFRELSNKLSNDFSVYLNPNITSILVNLFYSWVIVNKLFLKNNKIKFSNSLNLHCKINENLFYIADYNIIEAINNKKVFENGQYQFEYDDNELQKSFISIFKHLNWETKEIKLQSIQNRQLDFEDNILIYHSEGNHAFDLKSGECTFVFHAVQFKNNEAISLIKMPMNFNIVNLFRNKFDVIKYKNDIWLKMDNVIFFSLANIK